MSFKEKYLKYKNKYLSLKNKIEQIGGNQYLYDAFMRKDYTMVKRLLIFNYPPIDFNFTTGDFRITSIFDMAIESGDSDIVGRLLDLDTKKSIDIDRKDENGNNYLMKAINKKNYNIINIILKERNPRTDLQDKNGDTIIALAAKTQDPAILKLLQDYQNWRITTDMAIDPVPVPVPIQPIVPASIRTSIADLKIKPILIKKGKLNPYIPDEVRPITEREENKLITALSKDYGKGLEDPPNPFQKILDYISKEKADEKVLIIDGESLLGEFHYDIRGTSGNFYISGRYTLYTKDDPGFPGGIDYEFNPLLLFINYCIRQGSHFKLIFVCKDIMRFKVLMDDYNNPTNKLNIKRWNHHNGQPIADITVDISELKAAALHITIDIIHTSAEDSYEPWYPKVLKSYDDCLIIGLFEYFYSKGKNVMVYTRDKQIINDFDSERTVLLPFTVSVNLKKPFLFNPKKEPGFTALKTPNEITNQILRFNIASITPNIFDVPLLTSYITSLP